MNESIAVRIKNLREARKFTMQELADRVGVSRSMISYYESNKKKPSFDTVEKLANVLDVSTDYLYGKTEAFDSNATTNENVKEFLSKFEKLDKKQQEKILKILDTLAD